MNFLKFLTVFPVVLVVQLLQTLQRILITVRKATLIFFFVGIHLSSHTELCVYSFFGLNFVPAPVPADSPAPCDQGPFDN